MDREVALSQLATAHAVALRLRDGGESDESIAQALGIPVTAVESLVGVAQSKLEAVLGRDQPSGD